MEILPVTGRGTIEARIDHSSTKSLELRFKVSSLEHTFTVEVTTKHVRLFSRFAAPLPNHSPVVHQFEQANELTKCISELDTQDVPFWISFFGGTLYYGKGERRVETHVIKFEQNYLKTIIEKAHSWDVEGTVYAKSAYPDFVNVPKLLIVDTKSFTLESAVKEEETTIADLKSEECRTLYEKTSGKNFVLNTPDFPEFADAIERSINDPNGWCHKKISEKAGKRDRRATYLRVTAGGEYASAPGNRFVMEIWPRGHYSTIHKHADAYGIIKVLHGKITAEIYPWFASPSPPYFAKKRFVKDQVTWVTPELNQTHRLINDENSMMSITMQSYIFGRGEIEHRGVFDYIDDSNQTRGFVPPSDMDYPAFKALMRYEWLHSTSLLKTHRVIELAPHMAVAQQRDVALLNNNDDDSSCSLVFNTTNYVEEWRMHVGEEFSSTSDVQSATPLHRSECNLDTQTLSCLHLASDGTGRVAIGRMTGVIEVGDSLQALWSQRRDDASGEWRFLPTDNAAQVHVTEREHAHSGPVTSLMLRGDFLASGSSNNCVKVWSSRTFDANGFIQHIDVLKGHADTVNCLHLAEMLMFPRSGNGIDKRSTMVLFSGSSDMTVKVWLVSELASIVEIHNMHNLPMINNGHHVCLEHTLRCHVGVVTSLESMRDKETVLSGSADGNVKFWRACDGALLRSMDCWSVGTGAGLAAVARLRLLAERDVLLIAGSSPKRNVDIIIWNLADDKQVHTFTAHHATTSANHGHMLGLFLEPSGERLVTYVPTDHMIKIWKMPRSLRLKTTTTI